MRVRLVTVLVSVVLLASCSIPGPAPERQSSAAPSPSPTVHEPTELERQLTAQVYSLASLLQWAPDGRPAPMILSAETVTIGGDVTPLDVPGTTVTLYGTWENFCMEGRVTADGEDAMTAVYGPSGSFSRKTAPGQTCSEVAADFPAVEIPQENFPGVNGFEQVLITTGTCVDFIFWDTGFGEPLEIPIVRDCAGPHEYVIVEVEPLDLPDAASDLEIEEASEELCAVGVRLWELDTTREALYYWYWFPTAVTFAEGDRAVNCFAQVTEDVEQRTDGTDLFPN